MKQAILLASAAVGVAVSGCTAAPPSSKIVYVGQSPAQVVYQQEPAPQPVVSVYVEPPIYQPPPIRVAWAPPPMLVELPPPQPYDGAVWTGGYWVWEGNWIWAHGRWAPPPQPGYSWVHPYYENRGGSVIFVNGFWAAPGVRFVAPSTSINLAFAAVNVGVVAGPRPIGPDGCFVPPPPGSRFGLIVPAPIGTPPAVVTSAPPVIREGMRINVNNNITNHNVTNNTTIINNVTNVTIVAPANATASGQAVNSSVPAQAHLAAMMPPVVRAMAPEPVSAKAIPAFVPGRAPISLPQPQMVQAQLPRHLMQARVAEQARANPPVNQPMHQPAPLSPQHPAMLSPPSSPANAAAAQVAPPMQRDRGAMEQTQSRLQTSLPAPANSSSVHQPAPDMTGERVPKPANGEMKPHEDHPVYKDVNKPKPAPHPTKEEQKKEKEKERAEKQKHEAEQER